MTDKEIMGIKEFIATLAKEVILANGAPLTPTRFNRDFEKIYDFLVKKLAEK